MAQVDQVSLIAPGKIGPRQGLLHAGQGARHGVHPALGVDLELVVDDLNIGNLMGGQAEHSVLRGHQQAPLLPALQGGYHFVHFEGKGKVAHRLEHKVQGPHLIALDGVFGHVGDKNHDNIGIYRPNAACRRHTVQMGHLDVQQKHVIDGGIALHCLSPVRIDRDLYGHLCRLFIAVQVGAEQLHRFGIVLYYGNTNQDQRLLSVYLFSRYYNMEGEIAQASSHTRAEKCPEGLPSGHFRKNGENQPAAGVIMRTRITASSARVVYPRGLRVPALVPVMRPAPTACFMPSTAHLDTLSPSG